MKPFSKNFLSLQLQLKTILEDAGGDDLVGFLDQLSTLNRSEQQVALRIFKRTLEKFSRGTLRLETLGDLALKEFEDTLFNDLIEDIGAEGQLSRQNSEKSSPGRKQKQLGLLKGTVRVSAVESDSLVAAGSQASPNSEARPIDLASERARRKRGTTSDGSPISAA